MHTMLITGLKGLRGDAAQIRQGDELSWQIIPMIIASDAYKDDGVIIIWFDELTEDAVSGDNA